MKNMLLIGDILEIWEEANSFLEYLVAFWITGLAALAITGWTYLMVRFILNPRIFDNITWGLIDYI
jgi:hypothetical protein